MALIREGSPSATTRPSGSTIRHSASFALRLASITSRRRADNSSVASIDSAVWARNELKARTCSRRAASAASRCARKPHHDEMAIVATRIPAAATPSHAIKDSPRRRNRRLCADLFGFADIHR
jgi:hypothetical protein